MHQTPNNISGLLFIIEDIVVECGGINERHHVMRAGFKF